MLNTPPLGRAKSTGSVKGIAMPQSNPPQPQNPSAPEQSPEKVPDETLDKLHEANQRFSAARHHREEAIDAPSPEDVGRERAVQEFRDAEANLEQVTEEIDRDLHPSP